MKTLVKLLAVVPLLWLGGCYTQVALRDSGYGYQSYESENYQPQDSTGYYEQGDSSNNYNDYYYDNGYPGYNRRFFWGYYPSYGFNLGYYYDPFWYDWYGYSPYYYWGGGYYGYYPYTLGGYYGSYWGNYMPYTYYKYRSYTASRPRGNEGDRGSTARYRNSGGGRGSTVEGGYPTRGRNTNTGLNVDLGNVRASRDANTGTNSGARVSKGTPNSTGSRNAEVRSRNRNERQSPPARVNSGRRSGESRGESSRSYSPPPRFERPAPSYTPQSAPSSRPAPSQAPRSESSGRSSSGSRGSGGGRGR